MKGPVPQASSRPGIPHRWRRFLGPFTVLLAAAVAVAPQLLWGASCGHDFDFHLVSWFDALNAWRHGIPYPHWTPSANYGAGEPRFVFYSPLTWMLGAALGSALPWTLVPAALTFLILSGTGLATRSLAREALDETAATLAGCVAIFSGYALFTAYERSAFAELAGGCWIPLVMLFALRKSTATNIAALALAIAGAWLSNPTVGVMACYLLAAVAVARMLHEQSAWPALHAAAGAMLGLALVAVYLVPAAWQQRWVDIRQVTLDPGQTLENNWLFAVHTNPSMAYHDEVLHTVSVIAVLMVSLAVCGLLVCWRRGCLPGERRWWVPLALVPFAVLALQLPFSRPVWNLLPELRFLQFPWRWLVVLEAPMAIFVVAAAWPAKSARTSLRILVCTAFAVLFLAMTAYAAQSLYQPCDDEDAVTPMLGVYGSGAGFIGTYEYEPIDADNSLVAIGLPQSCLTGNASLVLGHKSADPDEPPVWNASQGSCDATFAAAPDSGPEHLHLLSDASHPGTLILRLRSNPAWTVKLNGRAVTSLPTRRDGLLAVPVPQGPADLTVDWTTTADVVAARWLSAFGVLALTGLCVVAKRRSRSHLS
jgi:hypothetical protein